MSTFDFDDLSYTKGQDGLDNIVHLIHLLDGSINQTVTPSFPSTSSAPSSLALSELLPPSRIDSSPLYEEGNQQDSYTTLNRTTDTSSRENIMSTYSPSSTGSCQSPRTIHSNLSTPTAFLHASARFEDKIIGSEKSPYFLNPFITTSRGQTAYLSAQGCQSVPVTTNSTMQSYFESVNNDESVTSQAMDRDNDLFNNQLNFIPCAPKQSSRSNSNNFSNNSYMPQFGRPFTPNPNNQNYDERYWINEQSLASTQIQNFDLLIESLSAEGTTKSFPIKKRAPSKTFEDIMPYLSGSTQWNNGDFVNVEAPRMYKRSKTDTTHWQSKIQNSSNRSDDKRDQHAFFNFDSINRQRQRSKTTSIVYTMKNAPIIPLKPTFSQLKEELHISPTQFSGLVGVEDSYDHTNVNLTTCKFVEQAARTALKGVKSQNEFEVSKRATAGIKARDEQNREKSKRYYDRKKAQNSAMSGLCNAIEIWQSTYGITLLGNLQKDLNAQQAAAEVASQDFQLPSERQKAIKEMQRLKEAFQISTIMTCAEKLNELLNSQPKGSAAEIVVCHSNNNQAEASQTLRSKEYFILQSGLHIWLDYLHCWADLVLAEKRLADKSGDRPICQIIRSLTELL